MVRATVIRAVCSAVLLALVVTGGLIITNRIADFQRDQYYEARKYQTAAAASLIDPNEVHRVRVVDTGRGIPERMLEETFKKFSKLHLSTDSRERGAGLGLSISKGLIEANGDSIRVESEEGVGSTFTFELPLYEAE